jgi:hypothetical protein
MMGRWQRIMSVLLPSLESDIAVANRGPQHVCNALPGGADVQTRS